MTPNQEKFAATYQTALAECVQNPKHGYCYGVEEIPKVAAKMMAALSDNTFNHDSPAFRLTAKRLGIKATRTAILAYWRS